MPEGKKSKPTKAGFLKLESSEIETEKKIDWDEITKKVGIVASIVTVSGFLISLLVLIVSIYTQMIDFSNRQTDLNIQLTNRVSQLEGKLEVLMKVKNR